MKSRILGAAAGLLVVSAAANAGDIFTDEESFLAAFGAGVFNPFDDVEFGPVPFLAYGPRRGYSYTISAPSGLFCGTGEVSTAVAGEPIVIDLGSGEPWMLGGNYWVRDANFGIIPGRITLAYDDGTKDEFASGGKGTFRGYRGDVWIEHVKVFATADGGLDGWAAMDNLYVGTYWSPECYDDCDNNGALDLFDFFCFVNEFNAGGQYADCDGNGSLDLFDFLCFVNAFQCG